MVSRTASLLIFLLVNPCLSFAQSEAFPFLAEVITDDANVRAGQSRNFEKLCQLNKGDLVLVLGKEFSWYKIKLPAHAASYISEKYVLSNDGKVGIVLADRVNVRAAARINGSIIDQLNKSERIAILSHEEGWYKIMPTAQASGWVSEGLIKFKSHDVAGYLTKGFVGFVESVKEEPRIEEKPDLPKDSQAVPGEIITKTKKISGKLIVAKGTARETSSYQLFVDDRQVYNLVGFNHLLNDLRGYQVEVEGDVDGSPLDGLRPAVVHIKNVQLIY